MSNANTDSSDPTAQAADVVELAVLRARKQATKVAYVFLKDGETETRPLTYGALWEGASRVAAHLRERQSSGDPVVLLYPAGLEFLIAFFGVIAAGGIAVPVCPPRGAKRLEHLAAIVADCGAERVLTERRLLMRVERQARRVATLQDLQWIATDELPPASSDLANVSVPGGDSVAMLQYTSGSTSRPRGVMLTHGSILYNQKLIAAAFAHNADTVVLGWLPHYHDMGLIGNFLQPFYLGAKCVFMSPESFLQRPLRWLQAISRYRATTSGAPNFGYDLCVHRISEPTPELDLNCWDLAFIGAEPIRPATLERFAAKFQPMGFRKTAFYPCYGLSEVTLFACGGIKGCPPIIFSEPSASPRTSSQPTRALVGCGGTAGDQELAIVDPERRTRCHPGEVGEIWLRGPSVALGYWNNPSETDRIFRARLEPTGEGPFLRTGDLGYWCDGQLFISGRLKNIIIINGQNYYPEDIEDSVRDCHAAIAAGNGAVFATDGAGTEQLVVMYEVNRKSLPQLDATGVTTAIRRRIAQRHQLPVGCVVLLRPGTIPKTTSGKIRHIACRDAFLQKTCPEIGRFYDEAPAGGPSASKGAGQWPTVDDLRHWLLAEIARHTGLEPERVDVCEPFAALGLDSIELIAITVGLSQALGRELEPTLLWEHICIADVLHHLGETFELD